MLLEREPIFGFGGKAILVDISLYSQTFKNVVISRPGDPMIDLEDNLISI